jgi:hypothetical protein
MNDAAAVRVMQRTRRLVDQLHDIVDPQQIVRAAIGSESAGPVHMLRHDVAVAVLLARVVNRQNVRMLQHTDHVRFGQEHLARDALAAFIAAGVDVVHLDGNVAPVIRVVRQVHHARAAASDLVDDHVLADLLGQRSAAALRLRVSSWTIVAQG